MHLRLAYGSGFDHPSVTRRGDKNWRELTHFLFVIVEETFPPLLYFFSRLLIGAAATSSRLLLLLVGTVVLELKLLINDRTMTEYLANRKAVRNYVVVGTCVRCHIFGLVIEACRLPLSRRLTSFCVGLCDPVAEALG